jgi:hypothetical protein
MKILIISDYLCNYIPMDENPVDNVKCCKWNEPLDTFFGEQDAIVIDYSFIEKTRLEEIKNNTISELEKRLTKEVIKQDNLIIITICGSKEESFKDVLIYDPDSSDTSTSKPIEKSCYDFLKDIIPEYRTALIRIDKGNCFYPLSIKSISVIQYLELSKNYYLFLNYNVNSPEFVHVYPLAKYKKGSNGCIAFEHRIGNSILIVLPGYALGNAEKAYQALLKVCRNYFKVRESYDEHELSIDIPKQIRDDYTEALLCFLNDLYNASVIMSGRALETSLTLLGARGKDRVEQIDDLFSKGLLYPKTMKLAHIIRKYRNMGAHFESNAKLITEKDAKDMLLFLKQFLHDVYMPEVNNSIKVR